MKRTTRKLLSLLALLCLLSMALPAQAQLSLYSHSFVGDSDAAAPAAGGSVGTTPLIDKNGSVGAISGGALVLTPSSTTDYNWDVDEVVLPASYNCLNCQTVATVKAGNWKGELDFVFRYQLAPSGTSYSSYHIIVNRNKPTTLLTGSNVLGLFVRAGSVSGVTPTTSGSITPGTNDVIQYTAAVSGTSTVTLTLTAYDVTTSTTAFTWSTTDTTPTQNLNLAGQNGLCASIYNFSATPNLAAPVTSLSMVNTSASTLAIGMPTRTETDATAIAFSASAATGGTPPYTYQWYRDVTPNFTPGAGNILAGQTSLTLTDTFPASHSTTLYYYILAVTDSAGTPTTVYATQFPAMCPISTLPAAPATGGRTQDLVIVELGDSITGFMSSNATFATLMNTWASGHTVTIINEGRTGSSTGDWIPGAATGYLTTLESDIASYLAAGKSVIVIIMLGTNDSRIPILNSQSTYQANLSLTVNDLVSRGATVILNYPSYTVPNSTAGGSYWFQVDTTRQLGYEASINALVNGTTILQGATDIYNYTSEHPQDKVDGIHPTTTPASGYTTTGVNDYAYEWANGIVTALTAQGTTTVSALTGTNCLNWTMPAKATLYNVYRDGSLIASAVNTNKYIDSVSGAHAYVVKAVNGSGEGAAVAVTITGGGSGVLPIFTMIPLPLTDLARRFNLAPDPTVGSARSFSTHHRHYRRTY